MENEELKDGDIVQLGRKDGIFTFDSKWPIFELDTVDKKGIWNRLQTQIQIMEYQNSLQDLVPQEIDDFMWENPDISFETLMFEDQMPDYYFLKYKNKVYCYTSGKKSRGKNKIYARFYFELEELIKP